MDKPENELDAVTEAIYSLFHHLLAQADYINYTKGKVPSWKYADYLLHCMKEELKKKYPEYTKKEPVSNNS